MTRIDDLELVVRDYSDPSRLEERFRAWREYHRPDMLALIEQQIHKGRCQSILEVGCGDGRFSDQLRSSTTGARVVAMDIAPSMAAQAALRGLDAQIGDIESMPWPDATFDVVVANWVLYHVLDLHEGLNEVRRVLRPGGRLIASTMSNRHMRELWDLVGDGDDAPELSFSAENGESILKSHFDLVEAYSMAGTATFPNHAAAVAHIKTTLTRAHLASKLEYFEGALKTTTSNVMFIAFR